MALPRPNASKARREGDSRRGSPSARREKPGSPSSAPRDDKSGNPFDVHPKNFTHHSLIWEIYKSDKE